MSNENLPNLRKNIKALYYSAEDASQPAELYMHLAIENAEALAAQVERLQGAVLYLAENFYYDPSEGALPWSPEKDLGLETGDLPESEEQS